MWFTPIFFNFTYIYKFYHSHQSAYISFPKKGVSFLLIPFFIWKNVLSL